MFRGAFATVALLLPLAAAAAAPAAPRSVRTTESHTFDHATTETKRFELRVPGAGAHARMRFRGSVSSGEIKARLLDPSGAVRRDAWRTPEGGKPGSFEFEAGEMEQAGVWTLEVELKEAAGSYEFTWTVD
jgi:hypothetical protein